MDHNFYLQTVITYADGTTPFIKLYNDTHGGIGSDAATYADLVAAAQSLKVPVTNLIP